MPSSVRTFTDDVIDHVDGSWFDVFKGDVPDTPPRAYCTVYPSSGNVHTEHLIANTRMRWTCRFICSGFGPDQALDVADAVRVLMAGWQPYPSDPSSGRFIELDEDAPLLPDETVPNDIRFSLTLTYRIHTNRS